MSDDDPRASIRRAAGWALVGGLTLAAFTAVVALLAGSFGELETRVTLTSIGFSIFASMAASGAVQRLRPSDTLQKLGTATAGFSALAFALLVLGLWSNMEHWGSEGIWRTFGCSAVLALACAHAGAVLGARRPSDSDAVGTLISASLFLAACDTAGLLLTITGIAELNRTPSPRAPEIRREVERLQELARSFQG